MQFSCSNSALEGSTLNFYLSKSICQIKAGQNTKYDIHHTFFPYSRQTTEA